MVTRASLMLWFDQVTGSVLKSVFLPKPFLGIGGVIHIFFFHIGCLAGGKIIDAAYIKIGILTQNCYECPELSRLNAVTSYSSLN